MNGHHRLARGSGGRGRKAPDETVAWYLHLCGSGTTGCHGWIEHHPTDSMERGWKIRLNGLYVPPAEVPVLYRGRWVLLLDDGRVQPTQPRPLGEQLTM